MELGPGYKDSGVGSIPASWEERRLGDVAVISSGGTPSRDNPSYWNGSIPWVTTSQIDFDKISEAGEYITEAGLSNSAAKLLPPGTLLMALYGQGKTRGKVGVLMFEAATNQACASITLVAEVSTEFVRYFLTNRYDAIRSVSNGGSQDNLSGQIVKNLPVVLPPLLEQKAIAAALSDLDALLGALDRLIAKKRDLKQAAMQQLLTGQTRLPGFSENWEIKRLGDHSEFLRNGTHSRAELDEAGPLRYLHYGDIHTALSCVLDAERAAMPRLAATKARTLDRLESGDVVFVDASEDLVGVGKSVELRMPKRMQVVAGLHTIAVRFSKLVLADGFKAYLQFVPVFRQHLTRLAAGTKVLATSHRHIADVTMSLPSVLEQVAIANVLADMDAELTALHHRRDKTRLLKQGMMQELLTGRTRLV